MKAKVIIENGETLIILTPENDFEIDVIENVYSRKANYNVNADFKSEYKINSLNNFSIELKIKDNG